MHRPSVPSDSPEGQGALVCRRGKREDHRTRNYHRPFPLSVDAFHHAGPCPHPAAPGFRVPAVTDSRVVPGRCPRPL